MDQLLAAIHALFSGADATTCAQANEWLTRYQQTNEAWGTALQLLHHPSAEVQYFGANTLYAKARSDWTMLSAAAASQTPAASPTPGALSGAEQSQLMNQLLAALKAICEPSAAKQTPPAVMNKLALALGVMAVKTPSGPAELLSSVLPLAAAPFPSPAWAVLLELLAALGDEVSSAQMSYSRGEEVKSQLRRQADSVGAALAKALREARAMHAQAATTQQHEQQTLNSLTSKALSVLISWRDYGLSSTQLLSSGVLGSVCDLASGWFHVNLASSTATSSLSLLSLVVELLESLLGEGVYPRPRSRDQIADMLVGLVVNACKPVYERTVKECVALRAAPVNQAVEAVLERADELCLFIVRLSAAIGEAEMDYLACHEGSDDFPPLTPGGTNHASSSPTPAPAANPSHLAYFLFHLQLSSHPYNRVIVELSLDTWSVLQDTPLAERKFTQLKGDIFVGLLGALIGHMQYPRGFVAWGEPLLRQEQSHSQHQSEYAVLVTRAADAYWSDVFGEDRDAFLRFRSIILETLLSIYGLLGPRYVEMIARALEEPAADGTQPWQRVEAILSALTAITSEVGDCFADEGFPMEQKGALHSHISAILGRVFSMAPNATGFAAAAQGQQGAQAAAAVGAAVAAVSQSTPPILMASCCAFLKSYSFLYKYASSQAQASDMVERSVRFLLGAVLLTQQESVGGAAAKREHVGSSARSGPPALTAAGAAAWSSEHGPLADQVNVAGLCFRALCASDSGSASLLVRAPALLGEVVTLLFRSPGFSERVQPDMKMLWLQGLASLVALIAYSTDSVAQVRESLRPGSPSFGAPSASMAMAQSYLQEITSPMITSMTSVMAHVAKAQMAAPNSALPQHEMEAVRAECHTQLALLCAVLEHLATPTLPEVLQQREELLDVILSVPTGSPINLPPSVALQVFSASWPLLQQASAVLLPIRDADSLSLIVRVYATTVSLLYPHELGPLLPTLLQSALSFYRVLPLPAVLELIHAAVSTSNFGASVDMRDLWNSVIGAVYKSTMLNTKDSLRSHADVFASLFDLLTALYEHATYAFVSNPANTFPHFIQLSVTLLDSLSTDRSVLQPLCKFLDHVVGKTLPIDALDSISKQELHVLSLVTLSEQGSGLLRQIVANITDSGTLPPLIDLKLASILHAAVQRMPDQAPQWIEKALRSEYVGSAIPHISDDDKTKFLQLLWPHRGNIHRWKSLWVEFAKVCRGQEAMDSLEAFAVQPSGKMRGSLQMDNAFATL